MREGSPDQLWLLLDLIDALRHGKAPHPVVCRWFVAGADAWLHATGAEPLQQHLGIGRRRRLALARHRLQVLLQRAADALAAPPEPWARAGALLVAISNYERRVWPGHRHRTEPHPEWSALSRSLFELMRQPLPIPRTQRGLFGLLKSSCIPFSVNRGLRLHPASQPLGADMQPMTKFELDTLKEKALSEYAASSDLQAEFRDPNTYVAWRLADAQGLIKNFAQGHVQ